PDVPVARTTEPTPGAVPVATPAAATSPASAPAAAAPATSGGPPTPVSSQLVARIAPLRESADGIHRLTMHLHPADLGPVQVVAEMRSGVLSLQLAGSNDLAREALRAALPDLRRELAEAGVLSGSLDVRSDDSSAPPWQQQGSGTAEGRDGGGRSSRGGAGAPRGSGGGDAQVGPNDGRRSSGGSVRDGRALDVRI
ncbi:MAG: flagellar hook-length control protein FliK, partial [Actinomycetota bacterium]|nr:flagellar hook-length control protein FliK [Actinomycetota bacterium]